MQATMKEVCLESGPERMNSPGLPDAPGPPVPFIGHCFCILVVCLLRRTCISEGRGKIGPHKKWTEVRNGLTASSTGELCRNNRGTLTLTDLWNLTQSSVVSYMCKKGVVNV